MIKRDAWLDRWTRKSSRARVACSIFPPLGAGIPDGQAPSAQAEHGPTMSSRLPAFSASRPEASPCVCVWAATQALNHAQDGRCIAHRVGEYFIERKNRRSRMLHRASRTPAPPKCRAGCG
eukprot:CAMPEP_0172048918 /NCGR_PEP_ID=MMETSP1043-20130122/1792_1 /TAXON_ID=464988 /ORGANISM="Hemiselmis andersenii, Strain CCMP441" /LENGTH=120 /DNA_ID=CAMNT_0012707859 /DNA_START=589 /DNA_END=948 /DNA_ORIENTATION=-